MFCTAIGASRKRGGGSVGRTLVITVCEPHTLDYAGRTSISRRRLDWNPYGSPLYYFSPGTGSSWTSGGLGTVARGASSGALVRRPVGPLAHAQLFPQQPKVFHHASAPVRPLSTDALGARWSTARAASVSAHPAAECAFRRHTRTPPLDFERWRAARGRGSRRAHVLASGQDTSSGVGPDPRPSTERARARAIPPFDAPRRSVPRSIDPIR